jgi:hypothetical protein
MGGRSPDQSAARKAMLRLYQMRNAFMDECQRGEHLARCTEQSEWYIGAGMARVLNAPTRQSSAQR